MRAISVELTEVISRVDPKVTSASKSRVESVTFDLPIVRITGSNSNQNIFISITSANTGNSGKNGHNLTYNENYESAVGF